MPVLSSYFYHTNYKMSNEHPIVFLHGSGRTEADGAEFMSLLGSGRRGIFPRAPYPCRRGYSFVMRKEDGSLDYEEIRQDGLALARFLEELGRIEPAGQKAPILVGHSSGAIMATSILWQRPELIAGAVLLRPQAGSFDRPKAQKRKPVMILSGKWPEKWDERRTPSDAIDIEVPLSDAGGRVVVKHLDSDHNHAQNGEDFFHITNWLKRYFPTADD